MYWYTYFLVRQHYISMKYLPAILLLSIYLGLLPDSSAQKKFMGTPIIEHYTGHDYGWDKWNQMIRQDERGLILVANMDGLMIYDGARWVKIETRSQGRIPHCIYPDPSGKILIGHKNIGLKTNEMGYFFPDVNGRYKYFSLNHLLPEGHEIGHIEEIVRYRDGYFYVGPNKNYFYVEDTLQIYPVVGHCLTTLDDNLFVNIPGKGLAIFENEEWQTVPNGNFFSNKQIFRLLEQPDGSILAVTKPDGLFRYKNGKVTPFAVELTQVFKKDVISSAEALSDESIAIGTMYNGLYMLSTEGSLLHHFRAGKGLRSGISIWDVMEDSFGNLWLSLANGIARIEWNSPVSTIGEEMGLPGLGGGAVATEDHVYFTSSLGIYVAEKKWPLEKISKVKNIDGPLWHLQKINDDILVSTQWFGLYQLVDTGFVKISDQGFWNFRETEDPNIIFGAFFDGLYRLEKSEGLWTLTKRYENHNLGPNSSVFDQDGKLWAPSNQGVYLLSFSEDYQEITEKVFYDTTHGLPTNHYINVFKLEDEVVFTTLDGIYQYDPIMDRFIPSAKWNERIGEYDSDIYQMIQDLSGNIYYLSDGTKRLKKIKWNEYENETTLFNSLMKNHSIMAPSILDEENVLLASPDGYVHYNEAFPVTQASLSDPLVRYVKLTRTDSILFGGNHVLDRKVVSEQPVEQIPVLPYEVNSIEIGYAAQQFAKNGAMYSYQLEGFDEEWSDWTERAEKEYTNLWEGDYTFKVKTKNIYEQISPVAKYSFTILPPWHRTYYAYGGYVVGVLGIFASIFLLYRRRNRQKITRLTREHLESEVYHKQTQLATTAMHLIEKTDFIGSIKTRINEILNQENRNVNRELKRIIKEIDRNAQREDVWQDFERHFDAVHEGFIQKLQNDHPKITPQEVKLSAYLRMNLSTKEIANLLQITVRGVEVARYRLRKKLHLDTEENLASFMMNY